MLAGLALGPEPFLLLCWGGCWLLALPDFARERFRPLFLLGLPVLVWLADPGHWRVCPVGLLVGCCWGFCSAGGGSGTGSVSRACLTTGPGWDDVASVVPQGFHWVMGEVVMVTKRPSHGGSHVRKSQRQIRMSHNPPNCHLRLSSLGLRLLPLLLLLSGLRCPDPDDGDLLVLLLFLSDWVLVGVLGDGEARGLACDWGEGGPNLDFLAGPARLVLVGIV